MSEKTTISESELENLRREFRDGYIGNKTSEDEELLFGEFRDHQKAKDLNLTVSIAVLLFIALGFLVLIIAVSK